MVDETIPAFHDIAKVVRKSFRIVRGYRLKQSRSEASERLLLNFALEQRIRIVALDAAIGMS